MTTEQTWAALKEAAETAGPAFWDYRGTCVFFGDGGIDLRDAPYPLARAAYIALANPRTILALEAEHSRLRAENERLRAALERAATLLDAAGKAISEDGWDMDFTHVDGIETDHIGFSIDCESAVIRARAALAQEGE